MPLRPRYLVLLLAANLACPGPESTGGAEVMLAGTTADPTTGVPTTGGEPTTGSTGEAPDLPDPDPPGPMCGNGIVEPGETCDDGAVANQDHLRCTADCQYNICGDGKVLVNVEVCDDGNGNGDAHGSKCTSQCELGEWCGDGKLQAEFETCDLGPDNGTAKSDAEGILCDSACNALRLRGFVTSTAFSGNLGGLYGADQKCQQAGKAANIARWERFHAHLSTSDVHAKDRFSAIPTTWPLVLVTGKKFADSWTSLLAHGPTDEGLSVTELGTVLYAKNVATNTAPGGLRYSPVDHCHDWTSADQDQGGWVGVTAMPPDSPDVAIWKAQQWWTSFIARACDVPHFHLYCIEIPEPLP